MPEKHLPEQTGIGQCHIDKREVHFSGKNRKGRPMGKRVMDTE
jgi:hypothetical protein